MNAFNTLASCALIGAAAIGLAALPVAQKTDREVRASTGTDWPIYRGDTSLRGVAKGELRADPKLAWTFETEEAITSSPVVANGVVYVGSSDQSLYAIDLVTGKQHWSFKTEDMIEAPPLVLDGIVYVGSSDFFFYALDAKTGEVKWKYETDDRILGSANWVKTKDGITRILVGSYDTHLYCFEAKTGKKLWQYQTDNYVNGTPAILDDHVVFGGCDAVLHVVSVTTGEAVDQIPLGSDCQVAGSVTLLDGHAYFGHYGNAFICVDLEEVDLAWAYPSDRHAFMSSPAIDAKRAVFGGRDKKLHCVDRETGKPLWTFATRRKVDGSPVICGDKVVFGSGDGRLYLLNLEDGAEIWQYEIGRSIISSPAVVDGMILIGSNDGLLYAFDASPGSKK